MLGRIIFLCVLALCNASCTVLTSETLEQLDQADRAPEGTFYALPKGVIDLILSVEPSKGGFMLTLEGPSYIPDPEHGYVLRYRPLPNYEDKIDIKTNQRSFLKSVHVTTTDQTPGIIVNVAKALSVFGALEAAPLPEGVQQIGKVTFDPLDADERRDALRLLQKKIESYIETAQKSCKYFAINVDVDTKNENPEALIPDKGIPPKDELTEADTALLYYDYQSIYFSTKQKVDKKLESLQKKMKKNKKEDVPVIWEKPVNLRRKLRSLEMEAKMVEARIKYKLEEIGKKELSAPQDDCGSPSDAQRTELCALLSRQREINDKKTKYQADLDLINEKMKAIKDAGKQQRAACNTYAGLKGDQVPQIGFEIGGFGAPPTAAGWRPEIRGAQTSAVPDCSLGICYRPKAPYRIGYGFWTGPKESREEHIDMATVELPNEQEPVTIDIRRAFFISKVQNIDFDDEGFLANVEIKKPSELLAVSKLPLDVIGAVADGLKIRVDLVNEQKNLAKREAAELQAQTKLRDTRARLESASISRSAVSLESGPARGASVKAPAASSPDVYVGADE